MNRLPLWKDRLIDALPLIGVLFALFFLFGGAAAVQASAPVDVQQPNPGSDSRGGAQFLIQVDMQGALTRRLDSLIFDLNRQIREKKLRGVDVSREGEQIIASAKDDKTRDQLQQLILDTGANALLVEQQGGNRQLAVTLKPEAISELQLKAVRQNMEILRKRINASGVAGAEVKRKGTDRIVVRLPGTADVARVRGIIDENTTLEIRLVDDTPSLLKQALEGQVPQGMELYTANGRPLLVKKQTVLTGEHIDDAESAFGSLNFMPVVNLKFDSVGATVFKEMTRENVGKRMAILLVEKDKGRVLTAPVISSEIGDGRVEISGAMSAGEAGDLALLLRAGALAAPMQVIEEQTIGPSSGKNAIE